MQPDPHLVFLAYMFIPIIGKATDYFRRGMA